MAIDTAEKRKSISGIGWLMPGVTPNASKDQEWRQEAGWSYSGIAAAVGVVFTLFGDVFLFTAANHVAALQFFFEAWHRATSGTSHARLFDITSSSPVGGSTVTTTSGTLVRQRSGALTLTDGNEYRLQLGSQAGDAGAALGGKVISFA